jgi:hypothetical protein
MVQILVGAFIAFSGIIVGFAMGKFDKQNKDAK